MGSKLSPSHHLCFPGFLASNLADRLGCQERKLLSCSSKPGHQPKHSQHFLPKELDAERCPRGERLLHSNYHSQISPRGLGVNAGCSEMSCHLIEGGKIINHGYSAVRAWRKDCSVQRARFLVCSLSILQHSQNVRNHSQDPVQRAVPQLPKPCVLGCAPHP